MRQFLQRGCNVFICPGWRSRLTDYTLHLRRNWEIFTSISSRKILNETRLQSVEHVLVLLLRDSWKWKSGFHFDVLVIWDSSVSLSPEVLVLSSLWIGRRGASQVDLSGEIQFRQVMLQPKWLFFSRRFEHFQSWDNFRVFPTAGRRFSSMLRLRKFQSEHVCNIPVRAALLIRVKLCSAGLCCKGMICRPKHKTD